MRLTSIGLNQVLVACVCLVAVLFSSCGSNQNDNQNDAIVEPATTITAEVLPSLVRVFPGLEFDQPVLMAFEPGGGRVVVLEQAGRILVFNNDDSVGQASVLLDISDQVKSGGEEGLLGFAFDPDYAANGNFFVYYSAADPRRSVISRFTLHKTQPDRADPGSEKIIMEVAQPQSRSNHKAGMISFGPDGNLYIALGDGGGSGDPDGNAQDLSTPLGKILRIDPHADDPYAVPADNPFANDEQAREEIWAYGFRNPYRFSFDRATGDLWAGDVGESSREEIDLVTRGSNYGWNRFEGRREFEDGSGASDLVPPVIDYGRDQGRSVIGGYVYRGSKNAALRGRYLYTDYYSGNLWALEYRDGAAVSNTIIGRMPGISSFAEDESGELFLTDHAGGGIFALR